MNEPGGQTKGTEAEQLSTEYIERGVITADGEVISVCSQAYLTTVVLEFLRAKAFPLVKLGRRHDWQGQNRRIKFLESEVPRLLQNPGLFPSASARARFAAMIALDVSLQFIQAVKDLLFREAVGEIAEFSRIRYTRPTYVKGSKGWENFLLNTAPGAPEFKKRMTTDPKSSYQIIPPVGMRVMSDNRDEERMLSRWILETPTPVDVQQASTTKLIDLDLEDEDEPNAKMGIRQNAQTTVATPNPFRERLRIRLDLPIQEPEPLEDYTPFLGRLDTAPPNQNLPVVTLTGPTMFPMVGVRSWHKPTHGWELRYRPLHPGTGGSAADNIE